MHKVIFYPVSNGDTSQIIVNCGDNEKRILFDFHHNSNASDQNSPHIDLAEKLHEELKQAKRDYFDIVAFTHADKDHICDCSEFFDLDHAQKYQGDNRIKIKELWVPAALILETAEQGEHDDFTIIRREARYRLKKGEGIRVFSKPKELSAWLESENLTLKDRQHLITEAGECVSTLTIDKDNIEFFCHSPFIKNKEQRNEGALIFNVRFKVETEIYNYLAIGDTTHEVLDDIIEISGCYGNNDRLNWDILNIPHHCSYKALSDEKGDKTNGTTEPTDPIKELLGKASIGAFMISSSNPIKNEDQEQPPHYQSKNAYKKYAKHARFMVTMEFPNERKPKPIEIIIRKDGVSLSSITESSSSTIIGTSALRAG